MHKILFSLSILFTTLFTVSAVNAETVSDQWYTHNEYPYYYSKSIKAGDHGLIIEGKQTGIPKRRPVNYALVTDKLGTEHLISYARIYGNTNFKIQLKAPSGSKCKVRIFVYGGREYPKGTIKVSPY